MEVKALMACKAVEGFKVCRVPLELLETTVVKELLALTVVKELLALTVVKELLETMVVKELLALMVVKELLALMVVKVPPVHKEPLVLDLKAPKEPEAYHPHTQSS
jgi:hypothetical protein